MTLPNDLRADHSISILSPLGSAYWGSAADQSIDWIDDAGQDHRLTVVATFAPGKCMSAMLTPRAPRSFSLQSLARRRD